ncbi:hypothetical protein JCGZ_04773 [Jatropha curcas]|uniref:Uncharacterized protein n=1 Tax=Jatropha curcas TaxID=180498 RepID=A0A067L0W3_JATCU|nr:hypothetical protein JCGZ_04773 [Jatropha curcas]
MKQNASTSTEMTTIANLTIPHFREVIDNARSLIDEAIARNLNINDLIFGPSSSFNIADLGCSVGPNTFICMENIIEAVKYKCQSQGLASPIPEFQVFFNDHVLNDFNTLFRSLPPKRGYFAAGVPGSFLGRLFSRSSLHLMHTSASLHWLSQMPEEILNNHSPVWNKGRIFYTNASDEVCKAYATQFEKDMEIFLDARAKELVVGGIILIMVPTIHDGISHSCEYFNVSFDILGSSLMDMAREGLVREVQVESFNLPFYIPSAKEKWILEFLKGIIDETIHEKLETKSFLSTSCSKAFCIADMGCSTGPNTFYYVHSILEAVERKFINEGFTYDQIPQFQLFPDSSLHFVHSSDTLHWLSGVPEEVFDMDSPAWNGGRVHYTGASEAVVKAFAAQFSKDMGMFLNARAKELAEGSMMVLIIPSIPDGVSPSNVPIGILLNHLGSCLMDMAKEGLICEALVDSFNIPLYCVTPKELTEPLEQSGCFSIERMDPTDCEFDPDNQPTEYTIMMHFKSGLEPVITKHFGAEIVNELFERFLERMHEAMPLLFSSNGKGSQLTVILKRKSL